MSRLEEARRAAELRLEQSRRLLLVAAVATTVGLAAPGVVTERSAMTGGIRGGFGRL